MTPLLPRLGTRSATAFLLTLGLLTVASLPVLGQSSSPALTWAPAGGSGGSGTWDETTANWFNGTGSVPWTDGDAALFGGTAGTVSINGAVTASQVTFSTPGYTVQNFFLNGASNGLTVQADADATISSSVYGYGSSTTPFIKTGAGVLTFTGQGPVFFGSANINAGEVRFTGTGSPNFTTPYILADAPGAALTFGYIFNQIASLGGGGTNGGVVRPNVTTGSLSLSIYGSGNASFGGTIQDNGNATLAFQKSGNSTQTLTGANTYSGATTASGGALVLAGANGSALNTASVSILAAGTLRLDNSSASNGNRLASTVPVTMSGGTFNLVGNSATDTTQTVGALSFSRASTVSVTPAGTAAAQLVFSGGMTRQNNGTISFSDGGNVTVAGLTNTNGIVGGYATVNGTDWAAVDANGRVSAYTGYTSTLASASSTDNLRLVASNGNAGTLPKTQSRNSLDLVNTGNSTAIFQIGPTQTLTLTSGGLLTSGSAGFLIQNGTLTTPGSEVIVTNQNALTVAATVTNGTAGAVTLTKSGAGTLALLGNNTYTGSTIINQGTVQVGTDANLGAGSVVTINGGTLQATGSFTSAVKSLQGSGGTVDTNGYSVAFNGGHNTGEVTKTGAGMLTLTGAVSNVNMQAGTLSLTNLATGNTASINLYGGRVEASGTGVRRIESFGSVTPPEISPGAFGQAASLTLDSLSSIGSTTVDFDLGSNGTDKLTLSTGLFLNGGNNPQLLFRFGNLGGTRTGTAYTLLSLPASNSSLNVASFGIDPASLTAGYQGTFLLANNTLSVTFTSVPEPGVCLWLCGALGIWGIYSRLGRKQRADKHLR